MGSQYFSLDMRRADQDQRWRAALIAAAQARRDYEAIADSPNADERAVDLLWLQLWRAERARDEVFSESE